MRYILFWRACNATNPYTFKNAMERLRKEGKTAVMKWFANLGKQSKWTKHKFNTSVCSNTNTSNFVESFNSTLGIDRCRPILTMLEGIRRVCIVRLATRQQVEEWEENSIWPKIVKMVKSIGKQQSFVHATSQHQVNLKFMKENLNFP